MKKVAIFDLDGTLLKTTKDIGLALSTALGHQFTDEQVNRFVGNGLRNAVKAAAAELGMENPDIDALHEKMLHAYRQVPVKYTVPYPGVVETLKDLQARGVTLAVYSNKEQDLAETVISKSLPEIDFILVVGRNGSYGNKPSAQAVEAICALSGATKDEVLYVGDSEVDFRTATNSEVDYRILTWGSRSKESLLSNGVPEKMLIKEMREIRDLF